MSKYPIDKNIPAPQPPKRGKPEKYPWSEMKVGDSFPFKAEEFERVNLAAVQAHVRGKGKYRVSKLQSRVWRIE